MDYFKKLMSKGKVSKAYLAVVSDSKVLPYSPTFLQKKHPAAKPDAPDSLEVEPILITFENVAALIRSSSKGASCGVDNFPIDILKQISKTLTKKEFPAEDTRLFLELLTDFFNKVFTFGQCPPGVLRFYDAGELIRLLQGATKIRPIGKATSFRKIFDVAQQLPHRKAPQEEFGDIQYCGASFGVEQIQNAINIHLTVNPTQSHSSSDASDAYCHADRGEILTRLCLLLFLTSINA
jgi:hypothetical protein